MKSIFIFLLALTIINLKSFSQAETNKASTTFLNISGFASDKFYSIEPGLEFQKEKYSILFSLRYANYGEKNNYNFGILTACKLYTSRQVKKFRAFTQGSVYLMVIQARQVTNLYRNSNAYGFTLFLGGGFQYAFSEKFSCGLAANIGWGKEKDVYFLGFKQPENYAGSFFMLNPQVILRFKI